MSVFQGKKEPLFKRELGVSGYEYSAGTQTIEYTVNQKSSYMIVQFLPSDSEETLGVTWNGTAFELISNPTTDAFAIFGLANPEVGTHDIVIIAASGISITHIFTIS